MADLHVDRERTRQRTAVLQQREIEPAKDVGDLPWHGLGKRRLARRDARYVYQTSGRRRGRKGVHGGDYDPAGW